MKKILSGVLAAASLLTMTVSASAAAGEKKVTAAGEVEYDVAVTAPKVVLNLIMPAKMSAALNPYGADIKLNADVLDDDGKVTTPATTTNAGIASTAYQLVNMSLDYGIVIDATATTTISAAKDDTWAVKTSEPVDGTKSAQMAIVTAADVDALKEVMEGELKETPASIMMLDSAKTTKQKKFISIGAATETEDEENPIVGTSAVMGFAGKLAGSTEAKDVEWTEDDAINVALVLKVVAGPKGDGGTSGTWTATGTTGAATLSSSVGTFANTSGNNYTWTLSATEAASAGTVTPTLKLASGWTVQTATKDSGRALTGTVNTTTGAFEIDNRAAANDTGVVTITITDGSTTEDIVINITVTA